MTTTITFEVKSCLCCSLFRQVKSAPEKHDGDDAPHTGLERVTTG